MIAVCIPTYNQAGYLAQSIESVLQQTRAPAQIWISDDASTDDTPEVAKGMCERVPIINYIRQVKNLGMGGNPNWLLRQPKTRFVAKLDSDDYYEPDYLEKLAALLERYPQAGYAHAAVHEVDEHSVIKRSRLLGPRPVFVGAEDSLRALVQGYRVAANIILFRREALESVNFWRADMAFADDWDLAVRLADAGWGNCHCPEVLANYRVWSDTGGYRRSRKLSEINGIRRVFEESLTPAFIKRGWDMDLLTTARRDFAVAQSRTLFESRIEGLPRMELVEALNALGSSRRLNRMLWISRHRLLSAPLLACYRIKQKTKDLVKQLIARK